ncbi:MAG: MFS transporter, partial [Candidatus Aenigmatarchaeota archaeon]
MKRGLKVLLISDSWINLALGMIGPIYAIFVEQIGGDILAASWAYSVYMFTAGIVMYLISRWENHVIHKEKLIIIGYGLTSVACLSYFFVYNQATLLITQIILGLSMALLNPVFDSLYSHYVKKSEETSDWGIWESMSYIVAAVAAIIGGYLADIFGFKMLFIVMFVISLLGLVNSLRLFKNKK